MTTSKLSELKALREKATQGEWFYVGEQRAIYNKRHVFHDHEGAGISYSHLILSAPKWAKNDLDFAYAAQEHWPTLIECLELYHAVLEKISRRPNLPNPDKDADWKNCMKWSSAEAKEVIAEIESKLGGLS